MRQDGTKVGEEEKRVKTGFIRTDENDGHLFIRMRYEIRGLPIWRSLIHA